MTVTKEALFLAEFLGDDVIKKLTELDDIHRLMKEFAEALDRKESMIALVVRCEELLVAMKAFTSKEASTLEKGEHQNANNQMG